MMHSESAYLLGHLLFSGLKFDIELLNPLLELS